MRGDGDGWATSPDGRRHWGRHGAAGLLLRAPLDDGTPAVLLQHRAAWSHQGGTWALPGGARDSHESTAHAAVREAHEEAGIDPASVDVRAEVVTMRVPGGWSYTTVLAETYSLLDTVPNGESTELRWVREAEVAAMPLHPGFADGWLRLQTRPVRLLVDGDSIAADVPARVPRIVALPDGAFGWISEIARSSALGEGTFGAVTPSRDGALTAVLSADGALLERLPASVVTLTPPPLG
ncbi:NUDIX hydrolase [Rhodococcus triatomae]|uniref:8-oxo-dGTP diphosphatase n=1 Tax=Rhodococcus triatomae TaxID=300028 RepID=A0A1G8NEU1_9NOCA|nr:NUDIX hydrolase [Rhodococcus triatomae]QNG19985.1 NUDIX hydrolase [Rhodococcus triatomae]QNG24100.1 NUDIX hydrolase [Rhodococcus triatomae]SDI78616.1 8-oxo-dGTP diphosphatase [Rhodococcus triatomae]